ncbi:MAG: type IV pilus assembly protein PilM [Patescibacteria group bacterium]
MALFNKKNEGLVGIDFGSGAIKVVELINHAGMAALVTYGIGVKDRVMVKTDARRNQHATIEQLLHILKESRVNTKRVVAALPAVNVFTTVIAMPQMPKNEIEAAIRWEAKKMVPLPLDKMAIDWHPVPVDLEDPKEKNNFKIIMTAAPSDVIEGYLSMMKIAGLQLVGLETEATALRRSLLPTAHGCHLLLDMGASTSNVIIFNHGLPVVTRNIDAGGEAINHNIANAMNISLDRAAQFRDDVGLPADGFASHPVHHAIIFVIDNLIIQELTRVLNTYLMGGGRPIDQITIAGGCSHIKNLDAYLASRTKIKTVIGNPWQEVNFHPELKPAIDKFAPQLAVAIGLALNVKNLP